MGTLHPGPARDLGGDGGGHVQVLAHVGPAVRARRPGHRGRHGVGHVHQSRAVGLLRWEPAERLDDGAGVRLDEARVVEVVAHLVHDHRAALRGQVEQRGGDVLAVLPAAGVGGVGAGGDDEHPARTRVGGLGHRVGQVGSPVPVAPEHVQVDATSRELGAQGVEQGPVLVVDRAAAPEREVVLAHLDQPLGRDPPPGRDVLQKGHDVVRLLGTAE